MWVCRCAVCVGARCITRWRPVGLWVMVRCAVRGDALLTAVAVSATVVRERTVPAKALRSLRFSTLVFVMTTLWRWVVRGSGRGAFGVTSCAAVISFVKPPVQSYIALLPADVRNLVDRYLLQDPWRYSNATMHAVLHLQRNKSAVRIAFPDGREVIAFCIDDGYRLSTALTFVHNIGNAEKHKVVTGTLECALPFLDAGGAPLILTRADTGVPYNSTVSVFSSATGELVASATGDNYQDGRTRLHSSKVSSLTVTLLHGRLSHTSQWVLFRDRFLRLPMLQDSLPLPHGLQPYTRASDMTVCGADGEERLIICANTGSDVQVWNLTTGALLRTVRSEQHSLHSFPGLGIAIVGSQPPIAHYLTTGVKVTVPSTPQLRFFAWDRRIYWMAAERDAWYYLDVESGECLRTPVSGDCMLIGRRPMLVYRDPAAHSHFMLVDLPTGLHAVVPSQAIPPLHVHCNCLIYHTLEESLMRRVFTVMIWMIDLCDPKSKRRILLNVKKSQRGVPTVRWLDSHGDVRGVPMVVIDNELYILGSD